MHEMGIRPQDWQQMKNRLQTGPKTASDPANRLDYRKPHPAAVILGIDPSLRGTGFGIIRVAKPHPVHVVYDTIPCPARWEHSRCLVQIARTLRELIARHRPEVCVVEGLFYAQNLQTALTMGEARGAALATVAEAGLKIFEIAPRKVKQAIVGYGNARKLAVAKMVQRMLHLPETPEADAADALALALTQAQAQGSFTFRDTKNI
jgi:crossover junction endodeoxyribonuclease RuvC